MKDFGAQDLANVAWAMAVQLADDETFLLIASEAPRRLSEMSPQQLCNVLWAFAAVSAEPRMLSKFSAPLCRRTCSLNDFSCATLKSMP